MITHGSARSSGTGCRRGAGPDACLVSVVPGQRGHAGHDLAGKQIPPLADDDRGLRVAGQPRQLGIGEPDV